MGLKKIKAVFFDADGTIFDFKDSYCRNINDALKFFGFEQIGNEKIWKLRRSGMNAYKILKLRIHDEKKARLVEIMRRKSRAWRYKDFRPFKKSKWTLKQLKREKKNVFVISLRESKSLLVAQLKKFKLIEYVDDIFVIYEDPSGKNQNLMKRLLIKQLLNEYKFKPEECVIVGDSVADIKGGKNCGIHTIATTTGLSGLKLLRKEKPDKIINEISQVVKIIE